MRVQPTAGQLLAGTRVVLLDFDGPVCSIFAGYPAAAVAAELRAGLAAEGVEVPPLVAQQDDPLEVLRWTAQHGSAALTARIERALTMAELQAATSAEPTPYAHEVLRAAHETGRTVAIVSNNSRPAIEAYLDAHRLRGYLRLVVGRDRSHPDRMKPHPAPLLDALHQLHLPAASAVMIGDSRSDVLSAQAAGVRSIGYANKPTKFATLTEAGADTIVHSMFEIDTGLRYAPQSA